MALSYPFAGYPRFCVGSHRRNPARLQGGNVLAPWVNVGGNFIEVSLFPDETVR